LCVSLHLVSLQTVYLKAYYYNSRGATGFRFLVFSERCPSQYAEWVAWFPTVLTVPVVDTFYREKKTEMF